MESNGIVTTRDGEVPIIGHKLKVADRAPEFVVIYKDQKDRGLGDFDRETAKLPDNLLALNMSMDFPFAMAKLCETARIENVDNYDIIKNAEVVRDIAGHPHYT
ncbi:MAG: hypothetical protein ACLPX5_06350 [Dissulfurispiraceae bacterium]